MRFERFFCKRCIVEACKDRSLSISRRTQWGGPVAKGNLEGKRKSSKPSKLLQHVSMTFSASQKMCESSLEHLNWQYPCHNFPVER